MGSPYNIREIILDPTSSFPAPEALPIDKTRKEVAKGRKSIQPRYNETREGTKKLEEYNTLTVEDLRDLCRERDLSVGGRKAEIIYRLLDDEFGSPSSSSSDEDKGSEEEEEKEEEDDNEDE